MIDRTAIETATRQAAATGFARIPRAVSPTDSTRLQKESAALYFEPLEPVIGRVRQQGRYARVRPHDPLLPALWTLARSVQDGVRRSGVKGATRFMPNEAKYQWYEAADDGISAHRDQGFYRGVIVVLTLSGRASFTIHNLATEDIVEEWTTEPGEVCVLAGAGLGPRDRRPMHRVGPPIGSPRLSLTLRMKERRGR